MPEPTVPDRPDALQGALLARVREGVAAAWTEAEFGWLALAVFRYQYLRNEPYRRFCDRRGATPETVARWTDVPAVPTDAFKAAPLVCGDPATAVATFRTSGTTRGRERRGTHLFPDLSLYDAALREGFRAALLPEGARLPVLSLIPHPRTAPDSSLSHMAGAVADDLGAAGGGWFVDPDGGIDVEGVERALEEARRTERPVCVVGTSLALLHLLDALRERGSTFDPPAGSRLMDTGGFKGRSRDVTRGELYAEVEARLGIPAAWCVNEYGMTEMSSQFYDGVAGSADADPEARVYRGPPWVRTAAVDPETLAPLPPGATGVLRHWDLANLGSVMAIQTADLGAVEADGSFRLFGRARGAEARGCSLAMDELLTALGEG